MNKRPFLFGLGIGIIIGAVLLQLMLIGERQAEGLDNPNPSETAPAEQKKSEPQEQGDTTKSVAPAKKASDSSGQIKYVIVRIPPNTSLVETANILARHEIIKDEKPFLDLMRNVKVRAGYFVFVGNPSLQYVKNVITGTPLPTREVEAELAKLKRE